MSEFTPRKTTLRLPEELIKEFKYKAIEQNKTLTDLVIEAMVMYLKSKKKKEEKQ